MGGCGLGASGSGEGPLTGPCEHGKNPFGTIKVREFLQVEVF
jgi:hypothetical protein